MENYRTIKDGIVCEKLWNKANLKVMFLLKESYGKMETVDENGNSICYDLSTWISTRNGNYGKSGHTYIPCKRILKYINNISNTSNENDYINASAFVNCLNKYKGWNTRTKNKTLWKEFNQDNNKRIIEIIKDIQPNIIIFGGTYDLFKSKNEDVNFGNIQKLSAKKIQNTNTVFDGIVFVNMNHPAYIPRGLTAVEKDEQIAKEILCQL